LKTFSGVEISIQLIESSREWPDTLLKSKPYWKEKNLICLPDTRYEPESIWDSLMASHAPIAAATFEPKDFSTSFSSWGFFRKSDHGFELCEKPQEPLEDMQAWGLICFEASVGEALFNHQLESTFDHQWKKLPYDIDYLTLQFFTDLTRPSI
jgi:hypothetical protein